MAFTVHSTFFFLSLFYNICIDAGRCHLVQSAGSVCASLSLENKFLSRGLLEKAFANFNKSRIGRNHRRGSPVTFPSRPGILVARNKRPVKLCTGARYVLAFFLPATGRPVSKESIRKTIDSGVRWILALFQTTTHRPSVSSVPRVVRDREL